MGLCCHRGCKAGTGEPAFESPALDEISDALLGAFLEWLPEFQRRLAAYRQDGNRDLLSKLDEVPGRGRAPGRRAG
jgi:hypothetical protein